MIDRPSRQRLADAVADLLNGVSRTDDFTRICPVENHDRAVVMIWRYVYGLYDDLWSRRLTQLSPEIRAVIERCLLFLNSDVEYRWPDEAVVSLYHKADNFFVAGWLVQGCSIIAAALNYTLIAASILLLCIVLFILSFVVRHSTNNVQQSIMSLGDFEVWPFFSIRDYEMLLR